VEKAKLSINLKSHLMNKELIQLINITQYRLEKSIHNADEKYYDLKLGNESRSPGEILSHLVDVSNYGLSIINAPKPSNQGNSTLEKINENFTIMKSRLSEDKLDEDISRKLINGPLSDTLAHIGQLAFLRRLDGNPIDWENYTNAAT